METNEIMHMWNQHENMLLANARVNRQILRKLLVAHAGKRLDWLKIKTLAGLILPFMLLILVVIPRLEFTLEIDRVIGYLFFVPTYVIAYIWAIRLYLLIEKLNFKDPLLVVSRQLRLVERYKLRIKRFNLMLAPLMIIGIFLSAGMPVFSVRMIPFYVLCVISFLIGQYIRSRYGLVAQISRIDEEIAAISELERDPE
jgi:hypothetical protein